MANQTKPLLIYGLQNLVNPSFETDASGVSPPTGWDVTASVNGTNQVNSSAAHSAGDGLPSIVGLLQNTISGTAGNKAIARQRISVSALPAWVKTADGIVPSVEMVVAAMFKAGGPKAQMNAFIDAQQFSGVGATSTPGTGTLYATPKTRSFQYGDGEWVLRLFSFGLYDAATYIDIRLVYDIARGGFGSADNGLWDRAMCGFLFEPERGFSQFETEVDSGSEVNAGGAGQFEVVKLQKPKTKIDLDAINVMDGTPDDLGWRNAMRWMDGSSPGRMAFWLDREGHTNAEGHFQNCYRDPKLKVTWPKGILRKNYSLRLIAVGEGAS